MFKLQVTRNDEYRQLDNVFHSLTEALAYAEHIIWTRRGDKLSIAIVTRVGSTPLVCTWRSENPKWLGTK